MKYKKLLEEIDYLKLLFVSLIETNKKIERSNRNKLSIDGALVKTSRDLKSGPPKETESVAKACQILAALEAEEKPLRLRDVVERTGIHRATAFRILATLQHHGLVNKTPLRTYRSVIRRLPLRNIRIGYAAQSDEFAFSRAVTDGLISSAKKAGIELIVLNNAYSPIVALQNAEALVKEDVQLVMEFQTDSSVAPLISAKLLEKRIPLIAIEIPHPNAIYFGANNSQAGLIAGRYLGRWAETNWRGKVDEVILLGLPMAGSLPASRLTGALLGLREIMPGVADSQVRVLSGDGKLEASYDAVKQYLRKNKREHILVSTINDTSAMGALLAFKEAGREKHCAIVGQNASSDAILELGRPKTRLIGSVGYFPEKYGEQLIRLALQLLEKKQVPQANFVKHHLITPNNLREYYPLVRGLS
ncbi:substrate-binding domain-containing protein [Edaphobacter aggregans]|uniref:substrate-binding domain-containing protein n=1 Tax=Edaphobacter aggregans TaxID=570835 RepID=UPI000F7394D0|nr:substrate-binding domain-containing protein [Edaphobacter aggregans]